MSKQKPPCCGNCQFGEFDRRKDGQVRKNNNLGTCSFDVPPLPLSITKYFAFNIGKAYIRPDDTGCPTHEPRKDAK